MFFIKVFFLLQFKTVKVICSGKKLKVQNNSVPRQRAGPHTPKCPRMRMTLSLTPNCRPICEKYLQVLHYSCSNANVAGLRRWRFHGWCIYHIELVVLILCTVATCGPLDVLFVGSLGSGRTAGGAQLKRPEKQIIREAGSTSEKHRET